MTPTSPENSSARSPAQPSGVTRRGLMMAVAGTAAMAGAGVAWWRLQPGDTAPGAEQALWSMQFDTPGGQQPLVMRALAGKPLVLNFWATWCPPCVEELPLLNRFYAEQQSKGWQVVGLAIDQPSAVRKFLEKLPLAFPVGLAGLEGSDLGRSLGNLTGGLPFTVVFGADGRVLHRKMGQISADDLKSWSSLNS